MVRIISLRDSDPLILTLILTEILSFLDQVFFYLFLLELGGYLILALASSIHSSQGQGLKYVPLVMGAYLTEHIGYGLGFLTGILGKDFI